MSLIVARKHKNNLLIFSDTKLTYIFEERNNPKYGSIKAIILSPKIALCYAGNTYYAELALNKIENCESIKKIKETLLSSHIESNNLTDFILAVGTKDPYFLVLKNGKMTVEANCWIGSLEGFSKFQEYYLSNDKLDVTPDVSIMLYVPPSTDDDEFQELYTKQFKAMTGVIECKEVKEVGGFTIPLVFEKGYFCYQNYLKSFHKPNYEKLDKEINRNGSTPLSFGNAADGSFMVNFSGGKTSELALHFFQGNIGVIYKRENWGLLAPRLLTNTDEISFSEYLREKTSTILKWNVGHDVAGYAIKGDKAFSEKNFNLAIKRYKQAIMQSSKTWGPGRNKIADYKSLKLFIEENGSVKIPNDQISNLEKLFIVLGNSYFNKSKYSNAKTSYEQALLINSRSWQAKLNLGRVFVINSEIDEAVRILTESIDEHEHPDSYFLRGYVFLNQNDLEEAKKNFIQALKLDSTHELSKIGLDKVLCIEES